LSATAVPSVEKRMAEQFLETVYDGPHEKEPSKIKRKLLIAKTFVDPACS